MYIKERSRREGSQFWAEHVRTLYLLWPETLREILVAMVILQRETKDRGRELEKYYVGRMTESERRDLGNAVYARDILFVLSKRYRKTGAKGIDSEKQKILREIKDRYDIPDMQELDKSPNVYAKLNDRLRSLRSYWVWGSTTIAPPVFKVKRGIYKIDHKRHMDLNRRGWDINAIRTSAIRGTQEEMEFEDSPKKRGFRSPEMAFCTIYSCPSLTDEESDVIKKHLNEVVKVLDEKEIRPIIVVNMRHIVPKKWWNDWKRGMLNPDTYDPDMNEKDVRIREEIWGQSENGQSKKKRKKKED